MATLVLSAVGTAIGGPFGQALGALIGNQIDRQIFGSGSREGPRLKELSVTTSSYGQPMPRHFGRMRVAGSIIWATDIQESSENEGGGKGQPSTTTYNYSASFAVALSSTPLARVGRIWADGNLLRGSNGDLKVEGVMRPYLGSGNDTVDPLIAADRGSAAPAFRDCAYIVFENLALADYGNRIPALTFEVFADSETEVFLGQIAPQSINADDALTLPYARGFADEGGSVRGSLAAINEVMPLSCITTSDGLEVRPAQFTQPIIHQLPEQLASIDDSETAERNKQRSEPFDIMPVALRYYDEDLDYQPGVQRAVGLRPNGRENMVDLPATMIAAGARQLASENAQRARWHHERISWRVGVLDPAIRPGSAVSIPDLPGTWIVKSWEWFERGIELSLERAPPDHNSSVAADAGNLIPPTDKALVPTQLQFIEVPPENSTTPSTPSLYAAASGATAGWRGAALYAEQAGALIPIGNTGARRAVSGVLAAGLKPSLAHFFEPNAGIIVDPVGEDLGFEPTTLSGLAAGANRLLVGGEVLQFLGCEPLGDGSWRLTGLLRGRGGTEHLAQLEHPIGTPIVLLDSRLTALDPSKVSSDAGSQIAAIGRGDQEAVYATLANAGASLRPATPVHPRTATGPDLEWTLCWTRRARGHWIWADSVELPLVEEAESYRIGFGPIDSPYAAWIESSPQFTVSANERTALVSQYGVGALWVRQLGTHAASLPLHLANLT